MLPMSTAWAAPVMPRLPIPAASVAAKNNFFISKLAPARIAARGRAKWSIQPGFSHVWQITVLCRHSVEKENAGLAFARPASQEVQEAFRLHSFLTAG